jgi:hypothetical protein
MGIRLHRGMANDSDLRIHTHTYGRERCTHRQWTILLASYENTLFALFAVAIVSVGGWLIDVSVLYCR